MRSMGIPLTIPALLLAAVATGACAGAAHAGEGPVIGQGTVVGPDFQYVGQDDKVHAVPSHKGCAEAEGGGSRGVTNKTREPVALYREPGCKGAPVQVMRPGEVTQVQPAFASARFGITG
ncbi:hypothetical protein ACFWBF_02540 [Streptomyces sp. NPDC060028]|uniref:hypothetical protein n=1 Tax=Streptomyces sp. NPDC060028 TaxID=3347041 RepID=UPI0036A13C82